MRIAWFLLALVFSATAAVWGESAHAELERLEGQEETPAFRRAVVAYQVIREMYENAHKLPSIQPLFEVVQGYQALVDSLVDAEPRVAAVALDRTLQLGLLLGEKSHVLMQLKMFEGKYPAVAAQLATLGNTPPETIFGNGKIEVRGLELGELQDDEIVQAAFEVRSLSGKAERLALDLRVMNDDPRVAGPIRNYQSQDFFEVPATGWKRHQITLRQMFVSNRPERDHSGYRVLPGDSVVRATFGTAPDRYRGSAYEAAFENQFYQRYYVRRPPGE